MSIWHSNDGNADRAIFDRAKQREIDRLRIESEDFQSFYEERAWRMGFALVEHCEMLQSTFLAAQRDAIYESDGQDNYAILASDIHDVLKKHLETYEEAKELIENVNSRVISKNKETYEDSLGWLYHSPDSGTEWSDQHPVSSGEVPDALEVRPATAQNLRDELIRAWADLNEIHADQRAAQEAINDLQADYEELKVWVDNNNARAIAAAIDGIADDYMTSERHHPGYVLIPAAKFEQLRAFAEPKRASKEAPPSNDTRSLGLR